MTQTLTLEPLSGLSVMTFTLKRLQQEVMACFSGHKLCSSNYIDTCTVLTTAARVSLK